MPSGEVFIHCDACRFWEHKGTLAGFCRRHAPSSSDREFEVARWPETRPRDGCGEGEAVPAYPDRLNPSCEACLFWSRPGAGIDPAKRGDRVRSWWEEAGYCRRFAPRPGIEIGDHAFWRVTHAKDHCFDGRKA